MRGIVKYFQSKEHLFEKGGKYEKFYPAFEAFQTFLYSGKHTTHKGPHVRDSVDTKRYMSVVIFSLKPALLFGIYNVGLQAQKAAGILPDFITSILIGLKVVIPILIVTYAVGLGIEFIFAMIRRHEVNEGFLVTGILYTLILPPEIPLWMVGVGIAFGVIIGKEVFGGSGRNFLNPALTARAFLFFAYPAYMSGDSVWTYMGAVKDTVVDGFSGATALAVAAASQSEVHSELMNAGFSLKDLFIGFVPGSIGETSTIAALMGAAILLITRVGSWRTMLGCVLGAVSMALVYNWIAGPTTSAYLSLSPIWHLVMGGFAFGTVFMATDPVSSPHIEESKLFYGILIGMLTVTIRCINPAYPEGVMLAILLMNVFAPLIDHFVLQARLKKRIPNGV